VIQQNIHFQFVQLLKSNPNNNFTIEKCTFAFPFDFVTNKYELKHYWKYKELHYQIISFRFLKHQQMYCISLLRNRHERTAYINISQNVGNSSTLEKNLTQLKLNNCSFG
jgi:hypothetical protein